MSSSDPNYNPYPNYTHHLFLSVSTSFNSISTSSTFFSSKDSERVATSKSLDLLVAETTGASTAALHAPPLRD